MFAHLQTTHYSVWLHQGFCPTAARSRTSPIIFPAQRIWFEFRPIWMWLQSRHHRNTFWKSAHIRSHRQMFSITQRKMSLKIWGLSDALKTEALKKRNRLCWFQEKTWSELHLKDSEGLSTLSFTNRTTTPPRANTNTLTLEVEESLDHFLHADHWAKDFWSDQTCYLPVTVSESHD